jgi:hypothetical protein
MFSNAIGNVKRPWLVRKVRGARNSVQEKRNVYMQTVIMPGTGSGNMRRKSDPVPEPSTIADSSISFGTCLEALRMTKTAKGRLSVV